MQAEHSTRGNQRHIQSIARSKVLEKLHIHEQRGIARPRIDAGHDQVPGGGRLEGASDEQDARGWCAWVFGAVGEILNSLIA